MIAEVMEWDSFDLPKNMNVIRGSRTSNRDYNKILSDFDRIDDFLSEREVFSYAIPNRNTLNFTTEINLSQICECGD